jgi:hypothetical protein
VTSLLVPPRTPAAPPPSEYEVKAAFLYNFTKFVEWPEDVLRGAEGFVVCVFGEDPFRGILDETFAGKTVHDHPMVVRRVRRLGDAQQCHAVYVGLDEDAQVAALLRVLAGRSVLTVGESDAFLRRGGIISFTLDAQRLRFEINADAAEQARLKISSQLLKLATRVIRSSG